MKSRLDLQLSRAGFLVGWDPEISGTAATYTWTHEDGSRRKLVLTRDEGEGVPDDTEEPVVLGLYELDPEKGSWETLVHEDFKTTTDALAAIENSPWNV
jgi:hypothetical protein